MMDVVRFKLAESFLRPDQWERQRHMQQILEKEDHVAIPPMMYSDPFYRITYLIEEIRKYKWIEGEKGRPLSWEQARAEWTEAHREEYDKFLLNTLPSADSITGKLSTETENQAERADDSAEAQEDIARTGPMLSKLPHRASG